MGGVDVAARWAEIAGRADAVVLDGFHPVKHALRFGAPVELIVTADRAHVLALAERLATDVVPALSARMAETDGATLARLVSGSSPTRIAALARRPGTAAELPGPGAATPAPFVLLDDPRHLGNIGAVIRVAAGLGAAGVATIGSVDPWHPTAVRGSAGLHFAIPVLRLADLAALLDVRSRPLLALDAAGEDIRATAIPTDAVLAFGSERRGLSAGLRQRADALLALPMRPKLSSYNLATSVAMALYHWTLGCGSRTASG